MNEKQSYENLRSVDLFSLSIVDFSQSVNNGGRPLLILFCHLLGILCKLQSINEFLNFSVYNGIKVINC